jgi:hypothetical protein
VQEEFQQDDIVGDEHLFEIDNLRVSPRPDAFGGDAQNPLDQHPLIMRTVEHANVAVTGTAL